MELHHIEMQNKIVSPTNAFSMYSNKELSYLANRGQNAKRDRMTMQVNLPINRNDDENRCSGSGELFLPH